MKLKQSFLPLVVSLVLVPACGAQVTVPFTSTPSIGSEAPSKWYLDSDYTAPNSFTVSSSVNGVSNVLVEGITGTGNALTSANVGLNRVGYTYDAPATGTTLTVSASVYLPLTAQAAGVGSYAGIWGGVASTPGGTLSSVNEVPLLEFEGPVNPLTGKAQTPGFYGFNNTTGAFVPVVGLPASDLTKAAWFTLTVSINAGTGAEYTVTDAANNVASAWVPFFNPAETTIHDVTLMGYLAPGASTTYSLDWANLSFDGVGGAYATAPSTNTLPSSGICNGVYTGSFTGTVTVAPGATCILYDTTVNGGINQTGGTLLVEAKSTVSQSLKSTGGVASVLGSTLQSGFWIQGIPAGAPSDWFCGDTLGGDATYILSGNGIVLGNQPAAGSGITPGSPVCAANTINGNVNFQSNAGSDYVDGNTISGSVLDSGNNGYVEVVSNTIGKGGVGIGNITGTAGVNFDYNTIAGGVYLDYISGPLNVLHNSIGGPAQFLNISGATNFSYDQTTGNVSITGLTGGVTVNQYSASGNVTVTGNSGGVTVENLLPTTTGQTLTVSNNSGSVTVTADGSSTAKWGTINVNCNGIENGTLTVTNNFVSGTLTVSGNDVDGAPATISGNTAGQTVLSGGHYFNVFGNGGPFYNCSGWFIGAQAPFCINWLFYWLFWWL